MDCTSPHTAHAKPVYDYNSNQVNQVVAVSAPIFNANKLKLGLFGANCSGGETPTRIAQRWDGSWDKNLALARLAEDAGLEFLLPVARWLGYGGETDFQGEVLETIAWASALLAQTHRINVFTTAHTAFHHPIVIAKQIASMDQIGAGRVGLNVVCGWNKPEYDIFGVPLPDDHVTRYGYGQEWFEIAARLWSSEQPFDWDGKFFQLAGVRGRPKPVNGIPPIISAAGSTEGREFATRNANFLFTPIIDLERSRTEVAELKAKARTHGRTVGVLTFAQVVCRPTTREAEEYLHWYAVENADEEAVDNLMHLLFSHAKSYPPEVQELIRSRVAAGHGGYPLNGDPDTVAAGLEAIYAAGFAGAALVFVDYLDELPYFRDEVIPRLESRGLRQPATNSRSV